MLARGNWPRLSVWSAYNTLTMSVVTPVTDGPRPPPGDTAGRVVGDPANVRWPGPGRLRAVAPAPEGRGIPPGGMPRPVWMKSRAIKPIAARSVSSVSDTRRDALKTSAARANVSMAALRTIAVSASAINISASVKPASWSLRIGEIGRQDERAGRCRRVVPHDDANLPERRTDVTNLDLTREAKVRQRDVVGTAKQAVGPGLDERHQRAVVRRVDEAVAAGFLDWLRAVEKDAAVAAARAAHVAKLRPREQMAVACLQDRLGGFSSAFAREQLILRARDRTPAERDDARDREHPDHQHDHRDRDLDQRESGWVAARVHAQCFH